MIISIIIRIDPTNSRHSRIIEQLGSLIPDQMVLDGTPVSGLTTNTSTENVRLYVALCSCI